MWEFYHPVEAFPDDNVVRRIDWFGQISRNPFKESDPNIEVIMSPFVGNRKDPANVKAIDRSKQTVYPVGVGLLPILHVGSMWKSQRSLLISNYSYKEKTFNLTVSPDTMQLVSPNYQVDGVPLISEKYYHIGIASGRAAKCLAIKHDGDPFHIIIPVVEIIRSFYGISTRLAEAMFNGDIETSPDTFFVRKKTGFVNDTSEFLLTLNSGYSKAEGTAIAAIASSQDIVVPHVKLIHNSLTKNFSNDTFAVPETYLPFFGKAMFTFYGKWIVGANDRWRFLVFWIKFCKFKYPFEKITYAWDPPLPSIAVKTSGEPSGKGNAPPSRTRYRGIRQQSQYPMPVKNCEEPDISKPKMKHIVNSALFQGLNDIEISIDTSGESVLFHKTLKKTRTPSSLSTGDGTYRPTDIGKLEVIQKHKKEETLATHSCPDMFKEMQKVLEALKKEKKNGVEYRLLPVGDKTDDLNEHEIGIMTYFPYQIKEDGNTKEITWSFLYSATRRRRQAMVAEISHKGHFYYLFECEHRLREENGLWVKKEHYTTLVVYTENRSPLNISFLQNVLLCCTQNEGTWLENEEMPELKRKKFKHTWKKPEQLADHIFEYIHSLITVLPAKESIVEEAQEDISA